MLHRDELEPWERRKNESTEAFQAFKIYCALGNEIDELKQKRSTRKVAETLGKSGQLVFRWCRKHNWVERARAYDNELRRIHFAEEQLAIRKMYENHIEIAKALQEKAMGALLKMPQSTLKARNILDYLAQGVEMERKARLGDAPSNDLVKVSTEMTPQSQMLALVKSLERAREGHV